MSTLLTETKLKGLFDQHYIGLVEFSTRIIHCEESSRDIVQDVFVKLLENNHNYPESFGDMKPYLYTMVKNASFNYIRRKEVANRYNESKITTEKFEETILDSIIYSESINRLYSAMQNLPEGCRNVANMTFLQGKSNQEVADLCDVSINTVKTQKRRAVQLLRKSLISTIQTTKMFFLVLF